MALIESWFKQDLTAPVTVRRLQGHVFTQDNLANLIGVEILSNGSAASVSGTVVGYVIRADDATVVVSGTLDGNRASITLPEAAYAIPGEISIVIKNDSTTVCAVTGCVYRSTTDAIVDPGHVIPSVEELAARLDAVEIKNTSQDASIAKLETLVVNCGTISSLPTTITNSNIESDMVVVNSTLGTPASQLSDWTVTTSSGSLTISGTISGSTTLTLYLTKSR